MSVILMPCTSVMTTEPKFVDESMSVEARSGETLLLDVHAKQLQASDSVQRLVADAKICGESQTWSDFLCKCISVFSRGSL